MKQETLEEVATKEGLFRASQHNFNQAESGYNAKWFKRGALFGAKYEKQRIYNQIKELYDNENITGFSKLAYAKCLDIVEQFDNK
jgi:hypothetical protein